MRYSVCKDSDDATRCKYIIFMPKRFVFCDIFSVCISVAVLQVWLLAVADNLSYAHSNGMFSVTMARYPYVLVRE